MILHPLSLSFSVHISSFLFGNMHSFVFMELFVAYAALLDVQELGRRMSAQGRIEMYIPAVHDHRQCNKVDASCLIFDDFASCPVCANLGNQVCQASVVISECNDCVCSSCLCFSNQLIDRQVTAFVQVLRERLYFAADYRFEGSADVGSEVATTHGQAVDSTINFFDGVSRQVIGGDDDDSLSVLKAMKLDWLMVLRALAH